MNWNDAVAVESTGDQRFTAHVGEEWTSLQGVHGGVVTALALAEDEYLSARMHTFHSSDGLAVEDGWIHLPNGTLLATTRQTRLAG